MLIKEYILRVPEEQDELVTAIVGKLGAELEPVNDSTTVSQKKVKKKSKEKKQKKTSALNLFGTWKDVDIDPDNFRKQLWDRSHKF